MPRSLDVQTRLIELLAADPDLAGLYTGDILPDDVTGLTAAQSPLIAVSLAEDDFYTESLGGRQQGAHTVVTTFGIHVYVAAPDQSNAPVSLLALKTQLVTLTDALRECVWKYRIDPQTGPGAATQLWYNAKYRQPATRYTSALNYRKSFTQIDFLSWLRNR